MIGRIVSLEGPPAAITHAKDAFVSQGISVLKGLPGLQQLHVFFRPTEAAIVSVWQDSQMAMAAIPAMAAMQQRIVGLGLALQFKDYEIIA